MDLQSKLEVHCIIKELIMDFTKFSDRSRKVLAMAKAFANSKGHPAIDSGHILYGVLGAGGVSDGILLLLEADFNAIHSKLSAWSISSLGEPQPSYFTLPRSPCVDTILEIAQRINKERSKAEKELIGLESSVGTDDLLLGILEENCGMGAQILNEVGITLEKAKAVSLKALEVHAEKEELNRDLKECMEELLTCSLEDFDEVVKTIRELRFPEPMVIQEMDLNAPSTSPIFNKWKHDIGRRVKQTRIGMSLTVGDLAQATGLPMEWIEKVERGELSPSNFALEKVAAACKTTTEKLYEGILPLEGS
jgi:hypothetical protein